MVVLKPAADPALVVGLDVSTNTGVAIMTASKGTASCLTPPTTVSDKKLKGLERAIAISNTILGHVDALPRKPDLVVLEGYGFANKFTIVALVELGTLVRVGLITRGITIGLLTPNSLKKWFTGSGAAKKDQMLLAAYKRFGLELKDDNQADAVGLASAGLAYLNTIPMTKNEQITLGLLTIYHCPSCN